MVTNATIKKGYKKTESGVIPEDWEVKTLGEIGKCYRGVNYNPITDLSAFDTDSTFRLLRSNNVQKAKIVFSDMQFVDAGRVSGIQRLRRNDILICMANGSKFLVGKSGRFSVDDGYAYTFGAFMGCFRPDKQVTNQKYVFYLFQTEKYRSHISLLLAGSSINNLRPSDIENFSIFIPSQQTEQTAIATVLSDTDALIEHLEKLIAKKKAIKQGTMQQLLTGKKRLPGFDGEWEVKKLGDVVGRITTGKLDANAMVENGEYRFYTCAKDYYQIDQYAFDTEALLVSGNGANVGYIHYYKGKFNAYQRTYVLSDFSENIMFIKLFMDRNFQERIRVEVNAGNTPYITMGTLTDMQINVPPTNEEQIAIASVLSDMDAEIEGLEQKRDKYTMLKHGMMQQLLTGKIRIYANN